MKLILDPQLGWCMESKTERTELREFCITERQRQGVTPSKVGAMSGVGNERYLAFERGETKSLRVALLALEALGYNLFVLGCRK